MKSLLAALILVLLAAPAIAQDFDKGAKAHKSGDYAAALREFRPLAERGSARAQHNLAHMYENGRGVSQDFGEAVKWYRKAAEQGLTNAQHNLGFMYENKRAALQGIAQAQHNLGTMYLNGEGVAQNYDEALKLFRDAAEQGHLGAQNNLGFMYANGKGVPQDYVLAHMWFSRAAAQGSEPARQARDQVAMRMTPEQITEAEQLARNAAAFGLNSPPVLAQQDNSEACAVAQASGRAVSTRWYEEEHEAYQAAAKGDLAAVKALIASGLSPDFGERSGDGTLLSVAALAGQEEIVDYLLEAGSNVNARDDFQSTALHSAVTACQPEIVRKLLQGGADTNAKDKKGWKPIDYARGLGLNEMIKLLSE